MPRVVQSLWIGLRSCHFLRPKCIFVLILYIFRVNKPDLSEEEDVQDKELKLLMVSLVYSILF